MTEITSSMPSRIVMEDDLVLLYCEGKKWLVRTRKGGELHTHVGLLAHDALIGRPYGSWVTTSLGRNMYILKPGIKDIILKAERATQILYPKEWGYIVTQLGIGPGSRVLEIGTGSGVLTTFMAYLVRPNGHVYSYEVRAPFHDIASRNVSKAGLSDYVTLKLSDASKGVDEKELDSAVIDVGDPESVLPVVSHSLAGSAPIAVTVPTVNQVERAVYVMKKLGFIDVQVCELFLRGWETKAGALRPSTRMIGHTTYMIFARNVSQDVQLFIQSKT